MDRQTVRQTDRQKESMEDARTDNPDLLGLWVSVLRNVARPAAREPALDGGRHQAVHVRGVRHRLTQVQGQRLLRGQAWSLKVLAT
jgi:hypothetical protein